MLPLSSKGNTLSFFSLPLVIGHSNESLCTIPIPSCQQADILPFVRTPKGSRKGNVLRRFLIESGVRPIGIGVVIFRLSTSMVLSVRRLRLRTRKSFMSGRFGDTLKNAPPKGCINWVGLDSNQQSIRRSRSFPPTKCHCFSALTFCIPTHKKSATKRLRIEVYSFFQLSREYNSQTIAPLSQNTHLNE